MNSYPFLRQIKPPIDASQLTPLDDRCRTVQFNEPLSDRDFRLLADFLRDYPNVWLRVYGDDTVQDLTFLKFFPFLERFYVDVWRIQSFAGITALPSSLKGLGLGQTKSKAHSLRFLAHFPDLQELFLERHTKHIETIGELKALEKLTLRSVTLPDLEPLLPLSSLWWFALKLGGTKDLSLLPQIGQIKYLEIWLVRGLSNLSPISAVTTLQYLFLEALKQVERLPSLKQLIHLRRLHLETMGGLQDLSPILEAPALEELLVSGVPYIQPEDLAPFANHPSLKRVLVGLGSHKRNNAARQLLAPLETSGPSSKAEFEWR